MTSCQLILISLYLGQFLYNNYKQVLDIINNLTPAIEELKVQLNLVDADFHHWNAEELECLESLANEVEYDPQKTACVEALQSLKVAKYVIYLSM
jgi:cobalamin biosynthesis Co2+ chelatase CbiK